MDHKVRDGREVRKLYLSSSSKKKSFQPYAAQLVYSKQRSFNFADFTVFTIMQPKHSRGYTAYVQRIPTPLAVLVGIIIGAVLMRLFGFATISTPTVPTWRGGRSQVYTSSGSSSGVRHHVSLPTVDQRRRVLDLLTTLSPHYTKECTRHANPLYAQQARERYSSLIGHNPTPSKSWLMDLGLGGLDPVPRPSQEEQSYYQHRRDLSNGEHKYYFAINLYN